MRLLKYFKPDQLLMALCLAAVIAGIMIYRLLAM